MEEVERARSKEAGQREAGLLFWVTLLRSLLAEPGGVFNPQEASLSAETQSF